VFKIFRENIYTLSAFLKNTEFDKMGNTRLLNIAMYFQGFKKRQKTLKNMVFRF